MIKLIHFLLIVTVLVPNIVNSEEQCPQKRANKLYNQDFGMTLTSDALLTSMTPWMFRDYLRPWRYLESYTRDLGSTIKSEDNKFTINLDVQHFSPDEISVKTSEDYITVEAKHEEKKDEHGFVTRQFIRKYSVPDGVKSKDIISQLSSDGILTISAPRQTGDDIEERIIPVTHTGPIRTEKKEFEEDGSGTGSHSADEKCNI